jgi:hypothetical protein
MSRRTGVVRGALLPAEGFPEALVGRTADLDATAGFAGFVGFVAEAAGALGFARFPAALPLGDRFEFSADAGAFVGRAGVFFTGRSRGAAAGFGGWGPARGPKRGSLKRCERRRVRCRRLAPKGRVPRGADDSGGPPQVKAADALRASPRES